VAVVQVEGVADAQVFYCHFQGDFHPVQDVGAHPAHDLYFDHVILVDDVVGVGGVEMSFAWKVAHEIFLFYTLRCTNITFSVSFQNYMSFFLH